MDSSGGDREPVEMLAEEFLARRRKGERPTVEEYAGRYPHLADEIRDLFPALEFMEDADPDTAELAAATAGTVADRPAPRPKQIGDYRILREIGRGAMGIVYEAEQQSLGRRVALKVLPKTVATDAKALARFRREARAAARLHHTNIVPVFEVGQDGDMAYYAMQFIQGHSLDQVLLELRRIRGNGLKQVPSSCGNVAARTAAISLHRGNFVAGCRDSEEPPESLARGASRDAPAADGKGEEPTLAHQTALPPSSDDPSCQQQPNAAAPSASLSESGEMPLAASRLDRYYHSVAHIGLQVASALSCAHERKTVHRDVKPSNLLLDTSGVVWVADFGLAKFEDDGHTRRGDIVGTLRYMSPERFKDVCDPRGDIYSLGATLYELLVLRPAFEAQNQLELMDHISKLDPPRPWLLDRHIPRDLETIVLKAMDKDPQRRYRSASEMHEDLQRFLEVAPDFVHSLAFSHDSALLALQDRNGIVTVWEAATRKLKYAFRSHRATNIITHTRLAFSPKRHVLACISEDFRGLMLHDLERGVVRRLKGEVRGMQRLPSPRMVSLSPQQASGKNS